METRYAKTAKKMDMKKLKQSMWHLLAGSAPASEVRRRQAMGSTSPLAPCVGSGGAAVSIARGSRVLTSLRRQKASLRNAGMSHLTGEPGV